ncbi:hypothetical protein BJ165DRAFT_1441186 [Panaeolus papilionaceus]|nr:hypothetical protein BJ165DRAFT_1441186 [Panaeolus papilionaceus]
MPSPLSITYNLPNLSPEIVSTIFFFCHQQDIDSDAECTEDVFHTASTVSTASLISRNFYRISRQFLFHSPILRIPTNNSVSCPSIIECTPQLKALHNIICSNPDIVCSFRALEVRFQFPSSTYSPPSPLSIDSPLTEPCSESEDDVSAPLIPILQYITRHASLSSITLRGITPRANGHKTRLFDTLKWPSLPHMLRTTILDILHIDTIQTFDIRYFVNFPIDELWTRSEHDAVRGLRMRALRSMRGTKRITVTLHYVSCPPTSREVSLTTLFFHPAHFISSSSTISNLHLTQHPYAWQNLTSFILNTIHHRRELSPFRSIRHLSFAIPAREDDLASRLLEECGGQLESLTIDCGYSGLFSCYSGANWDADLENAVLSTVFPGDRRPRPGQVAQTASSFPGWQSRFTLDNLHNVRQITFQTGVYPSTFVPGVHESKSPLTPFTDELYEDDWDGSIHNSPNVEIIDVDRLCYDPAYSRHHTSLPYARDRRGYNRAHRSPIPWIAHILSTLPQRASGYDELNVILELDVTKVRQKVISALDWGDLTDVIYARARVAAGEDQGGGQVAMSVQIQVRALIPDASEIAAKSIEDSDSLERLSKLRVLKVVPV